MKPDFFQKYNQLIITGVVILFILVSFAGMQYDENILLRITPLFLSTLSLIIALKAFDQFGVRKIIAEKQIKAVLDLLEEIEKIDATIYGVNNTLKIGSVRHEYFKAHQEATKLTLKDYLNLRVYFYQNEFQYYESLFEKFKRNRFLPNEIKSKLNFIEGLQAFYNSKNDISGDFVIVNFNKPKDNQFIVSHTAFYTLEQLFDDFSSVVISCENWIRKHTDILE